MKLPLKLFVYFRHKIIIIKIGINLLFIINYYILAASYYRCETKTILHEKCDFHAESQLFQHYYQKLTIFHGNIGNLWKKQKSGNICQYRMGIQNQKAEEIIVTFNEDNGTFRTTCNQKYKENTEIICQLFRKKKQAEWKKSGKNFKKVIQDIAIKKI